MFYQYDHFGHADYFRIETGENFNFPLHLHNSFEFIYLNEGELTVSVDGKSYLLKKGESVIVFPNQLHSLQSTKSKHSLCIFSPELVKAYSSKVAKLLPKDNTVSVDRALAEGLCGLSPKSSLIEKKGALYSLCAAFDKNAVYTDKTREDEGLLFKVFEFVELNFAKDCSLERLSVETGYSYYYLSRSFKRATGISFNSYVNHFRINNACYLLDNTELSVIQCAMESGYASLRSFNRNFFALLNTTPSEYRSRR